MNCPYCSVERILKPESENQTRLINMCTVVKTGHFFRDCDQRRIQRYKCRECLKSFSSETTNACKYQKKRHLNSILFELLASGMSQRRLAIVLRVNYKTIVRKFIFLGANSIDFFEHRRELFENKAHSMIFDDVETFEHSKCKPLSITMAVEDKTRRILGFKVSSMVAKGLLAKKSRAKYGIRKDDRAKNRKLLFAEIKPYLTEKVLIKSDENPHYIHDVKKFFPNSLHQQFKGRKGCVVGQGELKAGGFDPIFSFNHTAAMLRANIDRLFRRTWNTTKKAQRLEYHIAIYALFHNEILI